ncbi:primosomal protein N' [uncultured Umboniibacter sp.]|uniref:primosomal protein N' n=1 Tax=uncultured Umboniibacter sp. TaxID=1798917 RepID=UPI00262A40B0|nr:primosomal protein N' [uncultured Umboniibacter sp.]
MSAHIVAVALPVPLKRNFHYRSSEPVLPGCRVRVPFSNRELVGTVVEDTDTTHEGELKAVIDIIDDVPLGNARWWQLVNFTARYYLAPLGDVIDSALPKNLRDGRALSDYRADWFQLAETDASVKGVQQQRCIEALKSGPMEWLQLREAKVSKATLKRLLELKIVVEYDHTGAETPWKLTQAPPTPNSEQQLAIDAITRSEGFKPWLIDGITGSGKTEVYLRTIEHCLAQGQQALVLVPEIALTPQTLERFSARFATRIAVLHSGLARGARCEDWVSAADGLARIIIGTRSAIFAPIPKLGLIVVDEEHDLSYKQQDGFHYNARDLAIVRAKHANCPVILGSATPSLESLANAERAAYQRLELSARAGGAAKPQVELVDTRQSSRDTGLTAAALDAVSACLARGEQALIFINRRGYSPALMCQHCGWIADCPSCTRHFTVHQRHQQLVCHHCDVAQPIAHRCPHCFSQQLDRVGEGTERIEERLGELFPETPTIRVDRDTTRSAQQLAENLDRVNNGEPCILVGTQMLAKGHHFERVTLVIVLDIDSGLYAADFRAPERTGQLLTQVMGRAGRAALAGQVLVQTTLPDHPLLQTLLSQPYRVYSSMLLAERQRFGQPPFSAAALLRADHPHQHQVDQCLSLARNFCANAIQHGTLQCQGPMPAPLAMRNGRQRGQLWFFATHRSGLHNAMQALDELLRKSKLVGGLRWSIDIDPQDSN